MKYVREILNIIINDNNQRYSWWDNFDFNFAMLFREGKDKHLSSVNPPLEMVMGDARRWMEKNGLITTEPRPIDRNDKNSPKQEFYIATKKGIKYSENKK